MKFKPGLELTSFGRVDGAPILRVLRTEGAVVYLEKWKEGKWQGEIAVPIPVANQTLRRPAWTRASRPVTDVWCRDGSIGRAMVVQGFRVEYKASRSTLSIRNNSGLYDSIKHEYFAERVDADEFAKTVNGVIEDWTFAIGRCGNNKPILIGDFSRYSERSEDGRTAIYVGNYSRTPNEIRRLAYYANRPKA